MSERATPRTDAAQLRQYYSNDESPPVVYADFARQLERELAEARDEIDTLRSDEKRLIAFSKRDRKRADDLSDKLAQVVCERDNAMSDYRQADTDSIRALHERNAERALAGRLALALECAEFFIRGEALPTRYRAGRIVSSAIAAYKAARQEKP